MASGRLVHWNGKDIPDELRDLPAGTYVLESVEGALTLTPDEEEGLRVAMASLHAGKGRALEDVRKRIDSITRR